MTDDDHGDPRPPVDVGGGVSWLDTCYPMAERHHHVSPYLLQGPEGWILVEAGSIVHQDELRERIEGVTDGRGPDAAVLSHYDLPHVANARAFREVWDFELYTSFSGTSANPEALGMGPSTGCMHEETREICGRTLTFPWPPLVDAAHSMWVYDHAAKAMFAADMGHYHLPGACNRVIDSIGELPELPEIRAYDEDALPFTRYLDPGKIRDAFRRLRETYDIEVWAPVHGTPIVGADPIETYHERHVEAIEATRATDASSRSPSGEGS
jgi:flavorubredoxin